VLERNILFSGSVFSTLGKVLTPKILGSSTKYWIFYLSVGTMTERGTEEGRAGLWVFFLGIMLVCGTRNAWNSSSVCLINALISILTCRHVGHVQSRLALDLVRSAIWAALCPKSAHLACAMFSQPGTNKSDFANKLATTNTAGRHCLKVEVIKCRMLK